MFGAPWLRLRSDEQLVASFRAGNDEAFRIIHDRYRRPLLAFVRQMLGGSQADAEDVVQDAFLRASRGLRAHDQDLNLRPWLYRIARNVCIDELRRHVPAACGEIEWAPEQDPVAESEKREALRRLVTDLGRLPEQQRSALLMRELGGMPYTEVSEALGITVPAVKSVLVRARLGLVQSLEARETACSEIRDELAGAHARGLRPNALARRHLRDCACCREYRHEIRCRERQVAALAPTLGVLGPLARLFGVGGGGATAGGVATGGGAVLPAALGVSATHVVALAAAAVIAAAGAVGIKEATATSSAHKSAPAGSALDTAVRPVPTAGAVSLLSHTNLRGGLAASSPPRQPSSSAAAVGSRPSSSFPASGTSSESQTATTTPTGGSSSSASSCPTGAAGCGGVKSLTPTGSRQTSSSLGSGGSTQPATSVGKPTGSGASAGSAPGTSTGTPTGSGTISSTATGTGTSQSTSAPPGTTTTPLGF